MMDKPNALDETKFSRDQLFVLHTKVLPTAERWMRDYPAGSSLYDHAEKTLKAWKKLPQ